MVSKDVSVKEKWMSGEEQEIFNIDARRRVATIEMMRPIGTLGSQSLGETLGDGGILIDYGCGTGKLGGLLSRRHSKILLQADVVDMREDDIKSNSPLLQLDRSQPPDFDKTEWKLLSKSVDSILLADVFDKVSYSGMESVESKIELLNRLSSLLTRDGKILIANASSTARQYVDSGMVGELQKIIETNDQLRDKVIFY